MSLDDSGYSFLFVALAEKHNAVIRKIRKVPPWEWGGEFLEHEPQVLRFLGTFSKRHPECAAFKTACTLVAFDFDENPELTVAYKGATARATWKVRE